MTLVYELSGWECVLNSVKHDDDNKLKVSNLKTKYHVYCKRVENMLGDYV